MWAEQDPGADIVYVPGLSRICSSDHGLVVLDGDDEDACARIVEVFGDTPGKVRTRRGYHNLYQATGVDLGKLTSLKKFGINADVKHGNSIVVAPPSRHQDDRSFAYAWDGCDETVIRDLPPFNRVALQKLVDSLNPSQLERIVHRQASSPRPLRDGSRKLGLNDRLVRIVWEVETETEMLKHALKINDEIGRADPRGPRTADQVMQVVQTVWRDRETGKIEKWSGVDGRQKRRRASWTC